MENKIIKTGVKNIFFVLLSQCISLLLSFTTAFVLPMFFEVAEFGYWQVYVFYTGYLGLFCFGFNDGIYLRYGKYDYHELPFKLVRSSVKLFVYMQLLITIIITVTFYFGSGSDKKFSFMLIALNIIIMGMNGTFVLVHQFTNRLKLYSFTTVVNKVLFLVSIILLLVLDLPDYKQIIIADTLTKIVVLFINLYYCKELIFGKSISLKLGLREFKENIQVGINLMIANLTGMMIIGLGRFMVERFLSIEEYGLYSFAISTTNLTLLFISSVSLALYPMLKRLSEEIIPHYYERINVVLCNFMFGMLCLYFIIYLVVKYYLPEYTSILNYLYILIPIVFAQGKMQLLINTYYKILREEKRMLRENISSVVIFIVIAVPIFLIYKSVLIISIGTLITMLWRCYASEVYIKRKMNINRFSNIFEELTIIVLFIGFAAFGSLIIGFTCYLFVLLVYSIKHFQTSKSFLNKIRVIMLPQKSK